VRISTRGEPGTIHLRSPDGNEMACSGWNAAGVAFSGAVADTSIALSCVIAPGVSGWVSGRNALHATFVGQTGDSAVVDIPVLIDSVKTWISVPSEGSLLKGQVAVRGVAAAPDLGTGFGDYRAWYCAGHQIPTANARTIDQLLGIKNWQPLRVPLASQMVRATATYTPSSHDAAWPNSNVGVQDQASEGLLAEFGPVKDTGEYTILVATETSKGLSSWDYKHFRWAGNSTNSLHVDVVDSTKLLHPSNLMATIDLSNSGSDDDSLVWGLRSKSASEEGVLILYRFDSDSTPTDGRILSIRHVHLDASWARLMQGGKSDLGEVLDSGNYAWRLEVTDPSGAGTVDTLLAFRIIPAKDTVVPPLTVSPGTVSIIPGVGVPSQVSVKLALPIPDTVRIDIADANGNVIKVLKDSAVTNSGSWNVSVDSFAQGIYSVRLFELVSGTHNLHKSVPLVIKIDGILLDTNVAWFDAPSGDTVWVPNATSEFKFRAKASGTLKYYPVRKVDYSLSVTGNQVVRNFLTVPWGLDYIKFYNSLEFLSQARWDLRSYYDNVYESGHRYRWSEGDYSHQTLWAPRWESRWRLHWSNDSLEAKTFIDSADALIAKNQQSRTYLTSPYYGDAPWIMIDYQEANSIASDKEAIEFRDGKEKAYANANNSDGVKGVSSNLKGAMGASCSYLETINYLSYGYQSVSSYNSGSCSIVGLTSQVGNPGDHWKGINEGEAALYFSKRDASGNVDKGVQFYAANGVAEDDQDPRAQTTNNMIVKGFRISIPGSDRPGNDYGNTPRIYWSKRRNGSFHTQTEYTLNDGDWADEDDQGTFMGLPQLDWNSPELLLHGRIYQNLNEANIRKNGNLFPDQYGWTSVANPLDSANCWTTPSGTYVCQSTFSGPKVGMRGFGYQPNIPALKTSDGRVIPAYRYIANYFDTTFAKGMASWQRHLGDTSNVDILEFHPVLNIGRDMMKATWDTLGVPYPLGAWTSPGSWSVETDQNGNLIAADADSGVSWTGYTGDTSRFLLMKPININSGSDLDSIDVRLDSTFVRLLTMTDSAHKSDSLPPLYGYVHRKGLVWQASLKSWRMNDDGTFGRLDTGTSFHRFRLIDTVGQPLSMRIYYRKVPVVLGDWSSELDTMFRRTNGWLYGAGSFNSDQFHGVNPGLPHGFTGMFNPEQFGTALPSSVSPFVRKDSTVIFNPNLDSTSLKWALDVYYPDGATLNADLNSSGAVPKENFQLQLDAGTGARSWVGLRGRLPSAIDHNGQHLTFVRYSVQVRPKNDTSSWAPLSVNRFYTADSMGGQLGTFVPRTADDPWETDTTRAPVLAWWDVSSCVGNYEAMVVAVYRRASDDSSFVVLQRKILRLGTPIDTDSATTVEAPYRRASLTLPAGSETSTANVQLQVLAPSEVVFPSKAPKVVPLGPVLKIQTDGKKVFSDSVSQPILQFNLSALDIFEMEGRTDFLTAVIDTVRSVMRNAVPTYHAYVLGEDGNLTALPAIFSIDTSSTATNPRQEYTATLIAKVPHFSWAFLQYDDGKGGKRPSFLSVTSLASGVQIIGRAEDSAVAGKSLYLSTPIPTDLVVSWTTDTGRIAKVSAGQPQRSLKVGLDGIFKDTIPWSSLPIGASTLLLHYASSRTADATVVLKASDRLHIWNFSSSPSQPIPQCGVNIQTTTFQADRPGTAGVLLEDSVGRILSSWNYTYSIGTNSSSWDACIDGHALSSGYYCLEFRFPDDTTQDRATSVAIGTMAKGIASIVSYPNKFMPSVTDPAHGATIKVAMQSAAIASVHLRAVSLSGNQILNFSDLVGVDTLRTFFWNALDAQGNALTGSWLFQAWVGSDSLSRFDTRVDLLSQSQVVTHWTSDMDTLQGDIAQSFLRFSTSQPVVAVASLQGSGYGAALWPSVPTRVSTSSTWSWSAMADALPSAAVVHWVTLDSVQAGCDTIHWMQKPRRNPFDSIVMLPATDTLWHGLTSSLAQALHGTLPESFQMTFDVAHNASLLLHVTDFKGRIVRNDTITFSAGAGTLTWTGTGKGDSVLMTGDYRLAVSTLDTAVVQPVLVERTFHLQELPELVVVKDPFGRAQQVAKWLRDNASVDAVVWSDSAAVAYMDARPHGAVAWMRGGVDSFLVTAHPWSPVYRFIRAGGRFASLGWPGWDSTSWVQGDSVPVPFLSLLGLAGPFAPLDSFQTASRGLLRTAIKTTWIDSSVVSDLSLLTQRHDTLTGLAVLDSSLQNRVSVWATLAGHDSSWADTGLVSGVKIHSSHYSQSFYARPILWNADPDSSGALIAAHPYAHLVVDDSVKAARDLAALIRRYFFSNDLALVHSKVKLLSDTVRPGDSLRVQIAPSFSGSLILDSVKIHLVSPTGADTVISFHQVSSKATNPVVVSWPWSSTWALGSQILKVQAEGFVQKDPATGDTVHELNLANNSLQLEWVNADTTHPWVKLDSIQGGHFIRAWSSHSSAGPFVAHGTAGSGKGFGPLQWSWSVTRTNGASVANWNVKSSVSDTVSIDQSFLVSQDISSDTVFLVRVVVTDVFGNKDSAQGLVSIDSSIPVITQWTILHGAGAQDPTISSVRQFNRAGYASDTLLATANDMGRMLMYSVYRSVATDTNGARSLDTTWTGRSNVAYIVRRVGAEIDWILQVCDFANNCTESALHSSRRSTPPRLVLWKTQATLLDSLRKDSSISSASLQKKTLLVKSPSGITGVVDMYDTIDPRYASKLAGDTISWQKSVEARKGEVFNFIVDWRSITGACLSVNLDGTPLTGFDDNPYLRDGSDSAIAKGYWNSVANHQFQRFIQIPITRVRHVLTLIATDSANHVTQGVVYLENAMSDLQVVDSAGDNNGSGADWGEVYMRRNVLTLPGGSSQPETWDYWLIQRRNPLAAGQVDDKVYRLLVDEDNDSLTGDTTSDVPKGFRGAELALEWSGLNGADDGSGAHVRLLRWNDTTKVWVAQDSSLEGLYPLKGYGFHMNELDNSATDSVGRGDQMLPSGKGAAAIGGVAEIGLRSGADKSLNPIRWAIVPWGAAGDTVHGSGGMLVFESQAFKPVTVDGDVSDWWPNNTPVGIEVLSRTDSIGDTLGVRIEVRNPGTRTQQGLQFKYWLHCDSMPSARLDSVPEEWKNLSVQSIVHDTSKATGTWAVTLLCGDCALTGGADFFPAAYLRLWGGDVAKNRSDDWSNSSQASSPNPKFPAYDLQGDVLFGSEPPPRSLHLPVARISPSGTRWITVGQSIVFNADSSYDPDTAVLSYEWWHSGTGIHGISNSDTLLAQKAGVQLVTLHVYDPAHPVRGSWATDSIYVVDSNGTTGTKPVRTDSLYLFDDQWRSNWSQDWNLQDSAVTSDSLLGPDGTRHVVLPSRGTKLLSLRFDSLGYIYIRASCDSSYWSAQNTTWCKDETDLSKYTNLEFKVAMDAGTRQPMRLWFDRSSNGQGNGASEEDYAYINGYMSDLSDPSQWQTVSIPLSEIYTEPQVRSNGWLQFKLMTDAAANLVNARPRLLLDDIRLVKYSAPFNQVVTTRKSGLQVLANSNQTSYQNQLGLTVRMLNQGKVPLQLDSMRMRLYYQTREGLVRGDTIFGRDTMSLQWWGGLPIYSTMDPNQITKASLSLSAITPTYALANQYGQIQWNGATTGPDSGLRLRTTASATFWTVMQNWSSYPSATDKDAIDVPMIRFNGGHSLAWSWPDSANFFQFAPHVVVDHLLSAGSWCRVWGLAPGEAQATVSYCSEENLIDPSHTVGAAALIKSHIVVDTLAEAGSRVVASAATSSDPMGHVLQFHWLDAAGRVIAIGPVDTVVVPDSGRLVLRLRVFDLNDPSRTGEDSATIRPLAKAAPKDSSAILSGSGGTWAVGSAWGSGNTVPQPEWRSSVDLSAKDSSCPVRLLPVGSDSILVIPFSKDSLNGVRFDAPAAALDRSHFTNLEFWVASSREWNAKNHRDAPVRIWLTQQTAPGNGDNNHANEEDFTLLQAYLGTTLKLQRHWQKVSIPLDELYQSARAANSDSTKLFLKFMLDNSFSGSVDTARRADLYLSGIRFVKYDSTASRVTTRKVGAVLTGTTEVVVNSWESRLDFRLLNTSSKALNSDSLRLRFGYWHQPNVGVSFSNNTGGQGTDESVSDQWFSVSNSTLDIPLSTDQWGRKANHVVTMAWNSAVPLAGTKGWEAIWLIGFYDSLFRNGRSLQHFNADSSLSFSLLTGIAADYRKPDGSWARIWGYAPGENPDTVTYWARENVRMPADSIAPAASVVALSGSCTDTSTHSGGGTDTGSTSNTSVAAGDTAALPSTGRDAGLTVASGTAGGKTATVVSQTRSDWSVKHTFTFDTAWAHHSEILVDIWVDPAQISGSAWLGSLSLSTFDGQSWISLDPSGGADLSGSVGTWKTLHFVYDPSRYVLGRSFDLQFLANGHGSDGSTFHFAIGAIRLAGTTADTSTSGGTPALPASSGPGISMDTLSRWSVCNACVLVADGNGGSAIAVTPASGNPVMQTAITVDSAFHAGTSFHVDLFSQFPLQGWESTTFVVVDEASGRYWDSRTVNLPVGVSAGWTRLEIPYDGSLYGLGTTATLKVVLNANAPSGKQIELDNLTWTH